MPSLIPLLKELSPDYSVPKTFPESFVEHHMDGLLTGEAHWVIAQHHWEIVVERVLDSDAVSDNADDRRAMRQAVLAASVLLVRLLELGRCPVCPRGRRSVPRQADQERDRRSQEGSGDGQRATQHTSAG
jgi:hypothetical protein